MNLRGLFGPDGEPMEEHAWEAMMTGLKDSGAWRLARTEIGEAVVSTVFTGIDVMTVIGASPPKPYETMVFGGLLDMAQERYPSREAALAGHEAWVCRAREAQEAGVILDEAEVARIPGCDVCQAQGLERPAAYDAKVRSGPWAYLCEEHFALLGMGLGEGLGQRLVLEGQ